MKTHVFHLIILAGILLGGAAAFFYLTGFPVSQLAVGILTACSYTAWGIMHHAIQKDLHTKVVVEYVLMGSIAVVLLLIALL